ncbi:ABC transporter substrate-binding protein [Actinopolymorpha pittospori]|uniref:Peptide/nickel transport system substrate-binding protein n=1 Tax=Actinopolymorpha pittospori TaxID=648752 RepID=A0A927MXT1_9ACTN|nr:ABC transporter substrate-binding protein [Actinopolymorpha pittospori]MBE1608886.1 peptide/nickel transport system substrate-binding protein [Actinopolymorpha pittospori]
MTCLRRLVVAVVASSALSLAACGGGGGVKSSSAGIDGFVTGKDGFALYTGDPKQGGTITIFSAVDFAHLDPALGTGGDVTNMYQLIYRQLTGYKYDYKTGKLTLVPDLATDTGTPNKDATVWTYHLKDGISFEDGSPITAEDVKFGIQRSMAPELSGASDYMRQYLKGAQDYKGVFEDPKGLDSIKVVDDKTIEFHLNQTMAAFPNIVAQPSTTPFPKDKVTSPDQLDKQPIASGPYRVKSFTHGQKLVMVRDEHWDRKTDDLRKAYPDSFEFVLNLDQNTIDQRLLSGQGKDVNALASSTNPILPSALPRIQQDPKLRARTVHDLANCTWFMSMKMTVKPLNNLKVRQAINYATDKVAMVNATGGPVFAGPADDMLLPNTPGRVDFDLYPSKGHRGDPAKAKQLLAEAGYPNGIKLTMDVRGIPKWQNQAEAVQQSLAKAGIDVKLNVIDAANFYDVIATPSQQHDMAISGTCSTGWNSGLPLLTRTNNGHYITETANSNISQLNDPKINAAFQKAEVMSDIDEQNKAYGEINKMIAERAPRVPLLRETPLQVVGENIGGAYAHAARTGYVGYADLGLIDPER